MTTNNPKPSVCDRALNSLATLGLATGKHAIALGWAKLGSKLAEKALTRLVNSSSERTSTLTMPRSTFKTMIATIARSNEHNFNALHDLLVKLQADLNERHTRLASIRVEVALQDPSTGLLRIVTMDFVAGWPTSVTARTFPIPGESGWGTSSVAGEAFAKNERVYVPDGAKSRCYCRFGDQADELAGGESISLFAVPLHHLNRPRGKPIGTMSVCSPRAYEFFSPDFELVDAYASVLELYFAEHAPVNFAAA